MSEEIREKPTRVGRVLIVLCLASSVVWGFAVYGALQCAL